MKFWEAFGSIEAFQAALVFIAVVCAHRAGGASSRQQVKELKALVQLWKGRYENATTGRHRKPEPVQVRSKTALPPWTPTLTVVRMPQPITNPGPDTIAMGAVTTGGMRALTDDYIAQIEADGTAYRNGLTAS